MDGRRVIEVLRLSSGKWLLSAGPHCVESDSDDRSLDAAIAELAQRSGESRQRIAVMVAREQLADV